MTLKQGTNIASLSALRFGALLIALGTTQAISEQNRVGAIAGTVRTPSGAAIAGASVGLAKEGESAPVAALTTTTDGRFSFEQVDPGRYTVTAESKGFEKARRENINLFSDEKLIVDLTLAPVVSPASNAATHPGQALGPVGYDDRPQLRSADFTGSVDPGGYSAAGEAHRASGLIDGVARLKNDSPAAPEKGTPNSPAATRKELAEIEKKLSEVAAARPQSFEAHHQLGEFYIHAGRLSAAIPYLEKAYRLDPSHYVNAYDLALSYIETQNYTVARKQLHAMVERQDTAELHDLLGEVEESLGNYVEAVNEYERAAQMEPSEKHIFDWGCELLLHRTVEPALEVFNHGVKRYPGSAKLRVGLGIALYSRGGYDDAVKAFAQATDLEPSDPRPYLFLAKVYNISNVEAQGASERLRRFAELQPNNALALYSYALSLWRRERGQNRPEDLVQVESLMKKAAALDPRFPEAHFQLGILYADGRDFGKAIGEFERAITLKPDFADAHYRLAQALVRSGEKTRAHGEFQIYERLHKQQLADTEKQRAEIRQFIYTMQRGSEP